jgi:hypothetical protein
MKNSQFAFKLKKLFVYLRADRHVWGLKQSQLTGNKNRRCFNAMKKKMSLTKLSKNDMKDVSAGFLIIMDNGFSCGCGCYYAGSGGSSTMDNGYANWDAGLWSVSPE